MRGSDLMAEMARRGILTAAVLAATGVLVLLSASAGAAPDWLQFRHPKYGFSISYPPGWQTRSDQGALAFVAVGPAVDGVPGTNLLIVVITGIMPAGRTLEDVEADLLQQQHDTIAGRLLRRERIDLRGIPALMAYRTRRSPRGVELYQIVMVLANRGQAYGVSGTTAATSLRLAEETRLLQSVILTFQPP